MGHGGYVRIMLLGRYTDEVWGSGNQIQLPFVVIEWLRIMRQPLGSAARWLTVVRDQPLGMTKQSQNFQCNSSSQKRRHPTNIMGR